MQKTFCQLEIQNDAIWMENELELGFYAINYQQRRELEPVEDIWIAQGEEWSSDEGKSTRKETTWRRDPSSGSFEATWTADIAGRLLDWNDFSRK
jgi:hypothetical protein